MSVRTVLVSVVLFLFTATIAKANLVASTPGEFSVSSSGAASYSIPIVVPPGTAGVEPKLSLNYSSQGRNGLLGVGWMIGGLSVIHRCPTNLVKDGFIDGIDFDSNDRFCLDGQPLIAINNDPYGASGTEYRTEINNFSKIISYGSTGNGPSYFKVWTKSGEIMEYGNTGNSLINPPNADGTTQPDAICWLLNKVTDTVGNYMAVTYFENESTGENYPERIDYTGNVGLTPYNSVEFTYETRSDAGTRFLAGLKMESTKRLKHVLSNVSGTDIRKYRLSYEQNNGTGNSHINSIEMCDEFDECAKTSNFLWNEAASTGWVEDSNITPPVFNQQIRDTGGSGGLTAIDFGTRHVDLNGDGLIDITHSRYYSGTNNVREAFLNTGNGWVSAPQYAPPVFTVQIRDGGGNKLVSADFGTRYVDLNGDGLIDITHSRYYSGTNNVREAFLNTGNGWVSAPQYAPPVFTVQIRDGGGNKLESVDFGTRYVDLNGDGLIDITHSRYYSGTNNVREAFLNTGNGWVSAPQYAPPVFTVQIRDTGGSDGLRSIDFGTRYVDLNGDGLIDITHSRYYSATGNGRQAFLNTGNGWVSAPQYAPPVFTVQIRDGGGNKLESVDFGTRYVDLNGDGLIDITHSRYYSGTNNVREAFLNTGNGWVSAPQYAPPVFTVQIRDTGGSDGLRSIDFGTRYVDLNGDGLIDITHSRYYSATGNGREAFLNTGNGWVSAPQYAPPVFTVQIRDGGGNKLESVDFGTRYVDLNGDGLIDITHSRYYSATGNGRQAILNTGEKSYLKSISNSLNISIEIDYTPITDNNVYTKGSSASFPEVDLQAPMYVVSESRTDNGIGGQNTLTYEYEGAKVHVQGRGLLGFAQRTVTDVDTNIAIETNYKQEFPFIGQVESTSTTVDGTLVSEEINTFASLPANPANGPAFPYVSPGVSKSYDVNGSALLSTVTTTSSYDSYGNPTNISVFTNDAGIDTYTTTTVNTYTNNTNKWHLGRLTQATVTKTGGAQTSPSRSSTFGYNSTTGLLNMETIESGADALVKTYAHDSFGNRISVTESGSGISSRTTTTSYDAKGQFPTTVTNALGHSETREYNDPYGNVTKLTGPNNLDTTWEYDSLGRKSREVRADGTETNITYAFCTGSNCASQVNGLASYKITTTSTGAATSIAYYDAVNRVILTEAQSFDGSSVFVETEYDAQGRVDRKSNPYFGTSTPYWTDYTYDDLGRVTQQSSPTTGTTTMSYNGFVASTTNDLGQTSTEMSNSIGQTIWTKDNNDKQLDFEYDAQGNLITVTDSEGNVTSNTYNLRGFKTQMVDPDMGTWTYNYNVLGELTSQTDAKNQTVSMTYDKLGRLVTRTENEGISTWTYDTASKGKGKLASVSHYGGYSRSHTYDSLGRPSSTTTVIGGTNYTTSTTYDPEGRVDEINYPGTSNFKVDHVYNTHGYLEKVRNANNTSEVFYQALAADHFGNITSEQAGNGVVTFRSYQQNSGRIHHIDSVVQDLEYTFNSIGNLTQRKDNDQSALTETFSYDNLNRLKSAVVTGAGSVTFDYDDLGNITYKSDVGNFTYGAGSAGPHAVTNAGGNTYTYDDNGNQISGDGKTLSWSSFNKPTQITKGSSQSNFTYGPDRARYLQVSTASSVTTTTTYIGGLYEKVEKNGSTEQKHFIRAGSQTIAIFTDRSSGTDATEYLHRDHLGSIDTITDENGAIVEKLSFDAFGKRRLSTWNSGIPSIVSNNTRGFTGHEMLDGVGLIHMNGRVYDPLLGRFMSADPVLQEPKNLQSYNRYSYVINNPLSLTDPSGFIFKSIKKEFKSISRAIRSIGRSIRSALDNPYIRAALAIAVAFTTGYVAVNVFNQGLVVAGAAGGFAGGFVGSGGDLKAAIIGGLTGAAAGYIGGAGIFDSNTTILGVSAKRVVAHGVVGGAAAEAQGGKFGQGFLSSAFSKSVAYKIQVRFDGNPVGGAIASAVAGGTASKLSGGKFENGALTSAFQYIFNQAANELYPYGRKRTEEILITDQAKLRGIGVGPLGAPQDISAREIAGLKALGGLVITIATVGNAPRIVAALDTAGCAVACFAIDSVVYAGNVVRFTITNLGISAASNPYFIPGVVAAGDFAAGRYFPYSQPATFFGAAGLASAVYVPTSVDNVEGKLFR